MNCNSAQALPAGDSPASIPTRPVTLRDVVKDAGGAALVAERLQLTATSVYGWINQGHLPLSDLQGRTTYSEQLAKMQKTLTLSPVEIRRLGLRL
ncbi:hypothetical protein HOP60_09910 [Halomonas daqingensis]|uniref:Uncharacterized protein n=1 Tax=Billgrantia desiderata TaxID=52021 RepID=A0ABS9B4C4_9GAMM|nr:hypothetical protein [Halomonas desiderata]MCE8042468.1 hypothetical protein [Halomonas desiderata]MCE8047043.1 hypothetical protein [Halomonas desiderata]